MTATIEAARIVNTVTWENDLKSFQEIKKNIQDIKKEVASIFNPKTTLSDSFKTEFNRIKKEVDIARSRIASSTGGSTPGDMMASAIRSGRFRLLRLNMNPEEVNALMSELREKASEALSQGVSSNKVMNDFRTRLDEVALATTQARSARARESSIYINEDKIRKLGSSLKLSTADAEKFDSELNKLSDSFRKGEISASVYSHDIANLGKSMRESAIQSKTLFQRIESLHGLQLPFIMGAYYADELYHKVIEVTTAFDGMNNTFKATFGGDDSANKQLQNTVRLSSELGLNLIETGKAWSYFAMSSKEAGLGGANWEKTAWSGFKAFQQLGVALNRTPAEMQRINMALDRMLSKGTVQARELQQELAMSIPGVKNYFAEAYAQVSKSGLKGQDAMEDLEKAMRAGKVRSNDVLPLVFKIVQNKSASVASEASHNLRQEINRRDNEAANTVDAMRFGGFNEGMASVNRAITVLLQLLRPLAYVLGYIVKIIGDGLAPFTFLASFIIDVARYLATLTEELFGVKDAASTTAKIIDYLVDAFNAFLGLMVSVAILRAFAAGISIITKAMEDLAEWTLITDEALGGLGLSMSVLLPIGRAFTLIAEGAVAAWGALVTIGTTIGGVFATIGEVVATVGAAIASVIGLPEILAAAAVSAVVGLISLITFKFNSIVSWVSGVIDWAKNKYHEFTNWIMPSTHTKGVITSASPYINISSGDKNNQIHVHNRTEVVVAPDNDGFRNLITTHVKDQNQSVIQEAFSSLARW